MALSYDEENGSIAIGSNTTDLRVDLGKSIQNPPLLLQWNKGQWNLETIQLAPSSKPEIRQIKKIGWKDSSYFLGAENNGPLHWIPLKNLN